MRRSGNALLVWLSKIDDYLADNFCVSMLSELVGGVQGQSERAAELVPDLGI
jgi:hypothetical protein